MAGLDPAIHVFSLLRHSHDPPSEPDPRVFFLSNDALDLDGLFLGFPDSECRGIVRLPLCRRSNAAALQ
jgi:hypothetical protein